MGRKGQPEPGGHITPDRACRLCKLLDLLAGGAKSRDAIAKKLRVDLRGFYRDLELLRSLGVEVRAEDARYTLVGSHDDALARLPFPDPGLSLRDARILAQGNTDAHRRLRRRLESFMKPSPKNGSPPARGRW